jgi:antitoxin CptB
MADDLEAMRKRLHYRAHHRGTKEMDLVLGSFAAAHLDGFDEAHLQRFAAVLEESDADFLSWVTGQKAIPDTTDANMISTIVAFANARHMR